MKHDCEICRGAGVIRLPIYRHASALYAAEAVPMSMKMEESHRTYACPECAHEAPEDKVMILQAQETARERDVKLYRSQITEAIHSNLARLIAHQMIKDGVIEFSELPGRQDNVLFRARVGVVSKARVATIDKRATDKMQEFLSGVLDKATDAIAVWGSHYTGDEGLIQKGQAIGFVREAFNAAVAKVRERQ